jgi:hypothetical protein
MRLVDHYHIGNVISDVIRDDNSNDFDEAGSRESHRYHFGRG